MDLPIGQPSVIYSASHIEESCVDHYVCPWSAYNAKIKDIYNFRGEEIGTGQVGCVEIQTVAEYGSGDCF